MGKLPPPATRDISSSASEIAAEIHSAGVCSVSPRSAVTSPPPPRSLCSSPSGPRVNVRGPRLETRISGAPTAGHGVLTPPRAA